MKYLWNRHRTATATVMARNARRAIKDCISQNGGCILYNVLPFHAPQKTSKSRWKRIKLHSRKCSRPVIWRTLSSTFFQSPAIDSCEQIGNVPKFYFFLPKVIHTYYIQNNCVSFKTLSLLFSITYVKKNKYGTYYFKSRYEVINLTSMPSWFYN